MRKPKTFTTNECMVREIRRLNVKDAAWALATYISRVQNGAESKSLAENRRLRGEVRRLRRALRKIALGPECLSPYGMEQEARAALAPRRRKKP